MAALFFYPKKAIFLSPSGIQSFKSIFILPFLAEGANLRCG